MQDAAAARPSFRRFAPHLRMARLSHFVRWHGNLGGRVHGMTESIGKSIGTGPSRPVRLPAMKSIACGVLALVVFACGDNRAAPVDAAPDAAPLVIDANVVVVDAPTVTPDAAITLACTIEELTPIFTCVQTSCAMDLTLTCITTRCGLLVLGLSPSCRTCVLTGLTSGDIATTTAACIAGLPTPPTPPGP